jgi:hypothetical protein
MRVPREWNRWRVGGAAVVLLFALLLPLLSTENVRPADDGAKTALPADLAKIPSDALFVASGRLAEVWSGDIVKPVREKYKKEIDEAPKEFKKRFGLSLEQIERMTVVVLDPPPARGEPLLFAHTVEDYDLAKILAAQKNVKAMKYKEKTVYANEDKDWAVYPLDKRSLVYAHYNEIRGLIDHPQPKVEGRLAGALRLAAGKHTLVCGADVKTFTNAVGDKLPGEIEPFRPLLQAQWGSVVVDLGKKSRVETALHFESEKDAKAAVEPSQTGLTLLRAGLKRGIVELSKDKEAKNIVQMLNQFQEPLQAAKIEQQGATLRAAVAVEIDPATVGLMFVQMVQKVRGSAARVQSANNLKQIALAMHNYNDTYGHLPPQATYDKNGKPMLSWRVMILPFIEQQNLYNQFHLDEPWDSEHNKKLMLSIRVKTYVSADQGEKSIKEGLTYYQGFAGKGAFFEGKKGLRLPADFPDGTSNTIMIVEASKGVPWTKPEDIPYDAEKPLPKLGLPGSKSYLAALCDGSVRTVTPKLTERTLRLAITRNDGFPLGADW